MSDPQPRRRKHSPGVYRRRRLVLLLILIAVGVGVWLLIAQPWRAAGEPTALPPVSPTATTAPTIDELPFGVSTVAAEQGEEDAEPTATATASAAPSPSPSITAQACRPSDLEVAALTDKDSYGGGENPQFSIQLTNHGEECIMNVGTTTQAFTVTSGSDTWWRSTDCQSDPSDMIVMLESGQTVTSGEPLEWDRTRSSVETCEAESRPTAGGGGATYHLEVEIGGVVSDVTTTFQLW